MIIFYSGEENRSLPEVLFKDSTIMLTYFLHGKGRSSSRFKKIRKARRQKRTKK